MNTRKVTVISVLIESSYLKNIVPFQPREVMLIDPRVINGDVSKITGSFQFVANLIAS